MTDSLSNYKVLDLFCGAGGLSLGMQKSGLRILAAVDNWKIATDTYNQNFSHSALNLNVKGLSSDALLAKVGAKRGEIDLIAGGPPCQGFSIQRIGLDTDDRNDLVLEFARLIVELRPLMFLMENVTGLIGKRGRPTAEKFERIVATGGYDFGYSVINAADYGVPQLRRRVIYVGWSRNTIRPFLFPPPTREPETYVTVRDVIGDLPSPLDKQTSPDFDRLHRRTRLTERNLERLKHIPEGGGFEDLPPEMRVECHKQGAGKIGHRYVYGRLGFDSPASTITSGFDSFTRGKFAHPTEDRNITLREGARIQTFPDSFEFCGMQQEIAAQIGNAVPPLLSEVFATAIKNHLDKKHEKTGHAGYYLGKQLTNDQLSLFGS